MHTNKKRKKLSCNDEMRDIVFLASLFAFFASVSGN